MFCGNCGHQNPGGTRFCEHCGQQIALPQRPVDSPSTPLRDYTKPPEPKKEKNPTQPRIYVSSSATPSIPDFVPPKRANLVVLWIRERLTVLGGLTVLTGFLTPWVKNGSLSGLNYFVQGLYSLDPLFKIDMQAPGSANFAFFVIVSLLLILLPITGLVSFFALTGSHGARTTGMVLAGISLLIFGIFLFGWNMFSSLAGFFAYAGTGVWLILGGLVWMIVMPMFAPPE